MNKNTLTFLAGALLILLLIVYTADQSENDVEKTDQERLFLPSLSNKINEISRISISDGKMVINITRNEQSWLLPDKDNFRADFSEVKALLVGLSALQKFEAKTSKSEHYTKLGVQDPDGGDPSNIEIKLYISDEVFVGVILGKNKPGTIPMVYARKPGESQAWLLKGRVSAPKTVDAWLDRKILDIPSSRVKQVSIIKPGTKATIIHKDKMEDSYFTIKNMPKNKSLSSANAADPVAGALQNLRFQNVRGSKDQTIASMKGSVKAVYETLDGLILTALTAKEEDNWLLQLDFDVTQDAQPETINEKEQLDRLLGKWVFTIAPFNGENLRKGLEDLTK